MTEQLILQERLSCTTFNKRSMEICESDIIGLLAGTALPWWAVVLWTVIGSVLFLLMAIAWCIMFGDQCYCAPHCADDDSHDDTDDLVPRPPKRRFWMPRYDPNGFRKLVVNGPYALFNDFSK